MLVLTLAGLSGYVLWHWRAALYLAFLSGGIGILSPSLSSLVSRAWMWLARGLGRFSNGLLLSLVFLLVVVPVGVVRRLRKKERLRHYDASATSNYTARDHRFSPEDFEKPG